MICSKHNIAYLSSSVCPACYEEDTKNLNPSWREDTTLVLGFQKIFYIKSLDLFEIKVRDGTWIRVSREAFEDALKK